MISEEKAVANAFIQCKPLFPGLLLWISVISGSVNDNEEQFSPDRKSKRNSGTNTSDSDDKSKAVPRRRSNPEKFVR